MNAADFFQIRR